ncbi:PDR/VanB family oxidoreductase [Pseudomonas sp. RGM2987]|uniref:PDR/VanB family oxidoreductase n=1 Tax=Pseudomonas sp. RGM2987 TaxID=2930090 RepID=UPI001FD6DAF4|nr:PDR/VanB family oxidoreductase [Pseudomonas sp. RGM2987]MCJ8207502.1 PDR/VanB family oxidoreductase [Pseudomonas sp. RGM2987]
MNAIVDNAAATHLELVVRQIRMEANGVNSYEFVSSDGSDLPPFTAGAHIDIHVGSGIVRQYSLCNSPSERHRYMIAVLKDPNGRGGSAAVHESIKVGDRVRVSAPRNNFELHPGSTKVVLLAGGIGVTPMKSMAHHLEAQNISYEMYYCAKGPEFAAFKSELEGLAKSGRISFHFDGGDPSNKLDIPSILKNPEGSCDLYYCGPGGFMQACKDASEHWPSGSVHFEHFKAPVKKETDECSIVGGFIAEIASTGERLEVAPDQSLAEALNSAGYPVETSCQSGLCGTCKVRYLAGTVAHQDFILDDSERPEFLTCCVSRAVSGTLLLDL